MPVPSVVSSAAPEAASLAQDRAALRPADETELRQRARREWLLWGLLLVVVCVAVTSLRLLARQEAQNDARSRLVDASHSVRQLLDLQLQAAQRQMQREAADLAAALPLGNRPEPTLALLLDSVVGATAVRLRDSTGRVLERRAAPPTASGTAPLTLRLSVPGGATRQTLDVDIAGESLLPLLRSSLYAADMGSVLDLVDGPLIAAVPAGLAATPADALRVQEVWAVEGVAQPLRLSLHRERAALLAPWRERSWVALAIWSAVFSAGAAALALTQRRRRSARHQRRQHVERLELALQGGDLGSWDADLSTGHILLDARANAMLGLPATQTVIGFDDWRAQVHPQDWPAVASAHQAALSGEQPARRLRCRMRHADGSWLWVVDRGRVLERDAAGRALRMVGTRADINAVVEAENAVRRNDERLRQVVRAAGIGVFDHDHLTGNVDSSAQHHAIWGFAADEPVDLSRYLALLHPDDAPRVVQLIKAGHDPQGGGTLDSEHRIVRTDGAVRWIRLRSQTLFEGEGTDRHAVRTVGGVTDITEARLAQDRLRQQAELLDRAHDAIVVRGLDGRIRYWNGGAERIHGWTAAEAVGQDADRLLCHQPDQGADIWARVLAQGDCTAITPERSKDGRSVQMEGRYTLMRDDAGQPLAFLAIKSDVTRRLELEAQLRQSQRLESVGQLTGGVAHDFNNLLTVMLGNVDLLAEQLHDRPPLLRLATMARQAAQRGAELTHSLLAFARRQPLQPQSVNVNDALAGMEGLLARTLSREIELELVRGAGLWLALIDPAQLESAVLNLVLNARDAMPGGGKITLETGNGHIDQDYADRHSDVHVGQYVVVSISDTGHGMSAEQLARAFEPFYTTKSVGKGTGLGLSMVYGFVKQSRGHIKLYSEPGQGTTVRIYLPRSDEGPAAQTGAAPAASEADYRGSASVLVVEDHALVRGFAGEVLTRAGYQVLLAEHGPAALDILRGPQAVDLLFTDVVMPGGMNGRELARQAQVLRPALKVLFTSGYTENAIVHQGRLDRGVHLLAKPYRAIELLRKLHAMLSQHSATP